MIYLLFMIDKKFFNQRFFLYLSVVLVSLLIGFVILGQTGVLHGKAIDSINLLVSGDKAPVFQTVEVECRNGSTITCSGTGCSSTEDGAMAPDGSGKLTGRCYCDDQRPTYCPIQAIK